MLAKYHHQDHKEQLTTPLFDPRHPKIAACCFSTAMGELEYLLMSHDTRSPSGRSSKDARLLSNCLCSCSAASDADKGGTDLLHHHNHDDDRLS